MTAMTTMGNIRRMAPGMNELLPAAPRAGSGAQRLLRFLGVGVANTALSIAVYQALLFVTGHVAAYVLAYLVGIVVAYIGYSRHVFDATLDTRRFVMFTLFYLLSCAAGSAINTWLIEHFHWHARLAIFATVLIMLAPNYLGSRWCLRGGKKP